MLAWTLWLFLAFAAQAQENQLKDIQFSTLPGDKLQMRFVFTAGAVEPKVFHTDNPARIVLDFPGVRNGLARKALTVNTGVVTQVNVIEGGGRTRVVVNLVAPAPYRVESRDKEVHLLLESVGAVATTVTRPAAQAGLPAQRIEKVDFRRGPLGEGRILVFLAQPNTLVDLREEGGKVIATFLRTQLPPKWAKELDVMDFATPVKQIKIFQDGPNVLMVITPATPDYEYLSYQSDRLLTIEFRPLTRAQKEEKKKKKFPYTGERLSLNFQDIPVRSVLQILADFTGLNIIAADTVKGNVTLRLNNVPWDQALDLVLKAKGLGKRREGNVIWVAPLDEIIKLEKKELEHVQFRQQKEPLKTEIIQLNYAKAADVMKVLKGMQKTTTTSKTQSGSTQGVSQYAGTFEETETNEETIAGGSILSPRGEVNIDARTNILLVKDTPTNLEAVRKLVRTLDRPVRQVLIESRVVIAEDGFNRELGVKLNAAKQSGSPGHRQSIIGGVLGNNNGIVDLPASIGTGAGGGMGIAIFKLNKFLMQLELSALQAENRGDVLSMPRVVTQDQTKASIEQGVEIPFQTVSQNGTQTQFKQAVLKLEVTPHITPDDNVIMDLLVKKDAPGEITPGGVEINKREIRTTVQVANGETVVLGGVYEKDQRKTVDKVPFFGDLPGFGFMFRKDGKSNKKNELLIFITPKVLKSTRL
ncbi:type IV pilus secretin PilQ [Methylomarinovum caldicuralii]|nr:type IV pilus secretin PilQ [Methylomarinovum caldicuralii]